MRPQLFAADHVRDANAQGGESKASMRPQLFAADHLTLQQITTRFAITASMRPQLFAADHSTPGSACRPVPPCFNEAAALRCGSPQRAAHRGDAHRRASMRPQLFAADHMDSTGLRGAQDKASMRPQLFAADHRLLQSSGGGAIKGFNEAAALRCGSPVSAASRRLHPARFNEAAALRCGSQSLRKPLCGLTVWWLRARGVYHVCTPS